ncbi:MAG: integrase [Hydrocarboniphaga sp.]|uniref:site-specific integrase n=1 Tax=Hydrocarboniphaga sp. TaxID=2033016 RepID=UPI00261A93D7|nr:site-specific integrase [Hydrocarboniphaga sp.]MDB5970095.1 integrase [Hydrocarboniphaga sp.]
MNYVDMASARKVVKPQKPSAISPALTSTPLSATELGAQARKAAEEILLAGQAENTLKSYRSALRYWAAWIQARYGMPLTLPVSVPVVVQFIVDHTARTKAGETVIELPQEIDERLVEAGFKGALGPLKMATVTHRLYTLSKLHQLKHVANPCDDADVRHLISRAKRAAAKRGEMPTKKTAATREPLEMMLATCDGSLQGIRDRALLLFAWASGGRRRSEVAEATVEQLRKVADDLYLYRMHRSKTNQSGKETSDKPLRGKAAEAMSAWLAAAGIKDGPLFRRLWKDRVGIGITPAAVADIVKRRAARAGIEGDWAGHSLRSGFVTEAGRRKIPLGDIMALTEHRQAGTVMGYYRSGELFESEVALLAERPVVSK